MFLTRKARVFGRFSHPGFWSRSFTDGSGDDGKNKWNIKQENPINRTLKILGDDMKKIVGMKRKSKSREEWDEHIGLNKKNSSFQTHCDVLIIGGGGVGSSIAYWLKKEAREGLNVVVVEKDPTYKESSTCLSVGGLRQQFSLEENIEMSLYGAEFLKDVKQHLGDDVEVNFTPHGYLMLATEEGAETLQRNSKLQNELGARNEILTADALKSKFPWLNTEGIAMGCHGLEKEGWFDPWALLSGFKRRALEYGAHYVNGEIVDFNYQEMPDMIMPGADGERYKTVRTAVVKMSDSERVEGEEFEEYKEIKFAICIIACGAFSGNVASLAGVGKGNGMLSFPLPVVPRKRYVYVFNSQDLTAPGLNTPLMVDPTNVYFRRDGLTGNYICGRSPSLDQEPSCENLDVDYNYFDTDIWPLLAKRVPSFENLKVCNGWAGYYDYNTFDENGIVGPHPYYGNLWFATGFSGHGIQQTPAIGRAIMEAIIHSHYKTIDLARFGFDRILVDQRMYETGIV